MLSPSGQVIKEVVDELVQDETYLPNIRSQSGLKKDKSTQRLIN